MGEPKPLASLTSGLLARKGAARPAMRRQPLGSGPAAAGANGYDDLGWNDMGYDVDPEQSSDYQPRIDIKPLLTGSMPAHNVEAEQAVDAFDEVEPHGEAEVAALPWAPEAAERPAEKPEVVRQQEALQARVDFAPAPSVDPVPAVAVSATKAVRRAPVKTAAASALAREKAAFTLRLDAERHLRLRLASAIYNRSAQQILIDVLDNYLSALPEIDAMASRLPASPSHRKTTHNFVGDDQ
jgi:hypothetical protein